MSTVQPSAARGLFDEIKSHGERAAEFIASFCNQPNPRCENDWLDFKVDPGDRNDKERKGIWVEALSGYANTGGGVIVWGIDAPDRCAESVKPITNPDALRSLLQEWVRDGTDPPVPNVEVESFLFTGANAGFVVCFVPESAHKPHCAIAKKCRQYFIRLADSFREAPTPLLRALFYPQFRAIPKLSVTVYWSQHESDPNLRRIYVYSNLANIGTGTARQPFLIVSTNSPMDRRGPDIHLMRGEWTKGLINSQTYEVFTGRPIHPGQSLDFFTREIDCPRKNDGVPNCDDLWFRFRFFADGQEEQRYIAKFVPSALECNNGMTVIAEPDSAQEP